MAYVTIKREEMHNLLTQGKFKPISIDGVYELVYNRPHRCGVELRVYTTISVNNNLSRDYGKDAIRVTLHHTESGRFVGKSSTTKRTRGWQSRLKSKINEAWKSISNLKKCPECDSYLLYIKWKKKSFLGCSSYPECTYSENVGS